MSAGKRLAACLAGAAFIVAGGLAWWQWPAGEAPATTVTNTEEAARAARIERLRQQIERERDRLLEAHRQQDRTEAELRALEQSLDDTRDRIDQLQQELEAGAEDG